MAVITGAASGIGHALAQRCAQEGMKLVLADIEEQALANSAECLASAGASVLAVPTDVSVIGDIRALAEETLARFGSVHLLCNNAGVILPGSIWETTDADWEWVIGVNLWGVIHGVRVFVPIMLEQDSECHIVNTASVAGLVTSSRNPSYYVSKHGVVALSEALYRDLEQLGAKIKVSVLCPQHVNTRITDAERNRPEGHRGDSEQASIGPNHEAGWHRLVEGLKVGMSPEQVADSVFGAVKQESFYILTHPRVKTKVQLRMEDILQERNPTILT